MELSLAVLWETIYVNRGEYKWIRIVIHGKYAVVQKDVGIEHLMQNACFPLTTVRTAKRKDVLWHRDD